MDAWNFSQVCIIMERCELLLTYLYISSSFGSNVNTSLNSCFYKSSSCPLFEYSDVLHYQRLKKFSEPHVERLYSDLNSFRGGLSWAHVVSVYDWLLLVSYLFRFNSPKCHIKSYVLQHFYSLIYLDCQTPVCIISCSVQLFQAVKFKTAQAYFVYACIRSSN